MDLFQLLIIFALSQWERPVDTLKERVFHFNSVAVLRVREENSHVLVRGAEGVRLHQVGVRAVGLHHRARDLALLAREHQLGNVGRVVSLQLIFPSLAIMLVWVLYLYLGL